MVLSLQGYDRAIIVDAAEMGETPGTWRRFTRDCLRAQDPDLRGTLHDAGLAEALLLGEALRVLPSEIIIFGIQPGEIGWSPGLTPAVAAAIPGLCEAIMTACAARADSE